MGKVKKNILRRVVDFLNLNPKGLKTRRGGKLNPKGLALFLDTSAIIDGRIADVVKTGFLDGTLVATSFILDELQQVADAKNTLKRNRGRRGLEVLEELKKNKETPFALLESRLKSGQKVDGALVRLAKKHRGKIVTVDYNLYKVGRVRGIKVLNLNELANAIKTVLLPGEKISIKIVQKGKEKDQGVGFLPDGTMVVVAQAGNRVGEEFEVKVERVLQTDAGRMVFAAPVV